VPTGVALYGLVSLPGCIVQILEVCPLPVEVQVLTQTFLSQTLAVVTSQQGRGLLSVVLYIVVLDLVLSPQGDKGRTRTDVREGDRQGRALRLGCNCRRQTVFSRVG
jgi:hypothetical protein